MKPEKKLSVKDVFDIFRDTYEGTPYDMTRTLLKVDRDGKAVKSPIANPFMNNDYLDAFKITSERTIACKRATYLSGDAVAQVAAGRRSAASCGWATTTR